MSDQEVEKASPADPPTVAPDSDAPSAEPPVEAPKPDSLKEVQEEAPPDVGAKRPRSPNEEEEKTDDAKDAAGSPKR